MSEKKILSEADLQVNIHYPKRNKTLKPISLNGGQGYTIQSSDENLLLTWGYQKRRQPGLALYVKQSMYTSVRNIKWSSILGAHATSGRNIILYNIPTTNSGKDCSLVALYWKIHSLLSKGPRPSYKLLVILR